MGKAAIKTNPFYQPAKQWQIKVYTVRELILSVDESFSDIALAVLSFEVIEDGPEWCVEIITDTPPVKTAIEARLALMSGMSDTPTPRYEIIELLPKDWVSEVEQSFPPLYVGRFYVHGSHVKNEAPHGKLALEVNAGAAFGSGEHATTSGCLLAISRLAKYKKFNRPLDMGCGSGILALAMAKLWHVPVIGIDIDPVSVKVAKENARKNKLQNFLRFAAGDGYNAALCRTNAPYDLIVANILARPLMKMAPQLKRNLAPKGTVILSGLLASQEKMVLSPHRAQGLRLKSRIVLNGWNTLVLTS